MGTGSHPTYRVTQMGQKERWISPLRYPGGKVRMAQALGDIFLRQVNPVLDIEVWIEPFAGGAGAGLWLRDRGVVSDAWLVERNHALATFWRAVVEDGEAFAGLVAATEVDLSVWRWAREALAASEVNDGPEGAELALAALVVNRCSRSGMVNASAGPIGGKSQLGRWRVDSRWRPEVLARRIRHIHLLGGIRVIEGDAIECIEELSGSGVEDEVFLFVDPPYVREGNGLYLHGFSIEQHHALAHALRNCPAPWLLTYDDEPLVADVLYPEHRVLEYEIAHTANRQGIGKEYAVLSHLTNVEEDLALLPNGVSRWMPVEDGVPRGGLPTTATL